MIEFEVREQDVSRDDRYHRVEADVRFKRVPHEDRGAIARIGTFVDGVTAVGIGVAHPGAVTAGRSVWVTGVTATGVGTGHPGTISTNEIIPGIQAVGVGVAHPGVVSTTRVVNVTGPVATGVGTVGAGTTVAAIRNKSIAGVVATATANAFIGVATAIRNKIVSGVVAQANASAPAGEVLAVRNVNISGVVATATGVAYPGDVEDMLHATIAGVVANADGVAPAGIVSITDSIVGLLAAAIGTAPAGTVLATRNVNLGGIVAAGTGQAPAGTVSGIRNPTVLGLAATGSGAAPAGTVSAVRHAVVAGALATALGAAPAGTVTAVRIAYEQSAAQALTNNVPSVTITTGNALLVISGTSNIPAGLVVTVDGSSVPLFGSQSNLRLWIRTVSAGSHTITIDGGGSWESLALHSYTGVGRVGAFTSATATSTTPSLTPTGTGDIAVAAFNGVQVAAAGTTSNGDHLTKLVHPDNTTYNLAIADKATAPVTLTQTSSAWVAGGMWLASTPSTPTLVETQTASVTTSTGTVNVFSGATTDGTVIAYTAGAIPTFCRIDGVDMTLVNSSGDNAMYYATGVSLGTHTITYGRPGTTSFVATATSYAGVTSVASGGTTTGTGTALAGATPGTSGTRYITGFSFSQSSSDVPNITTNGENLRTHYRVNGNVGAIADKATAPVSITLPTSSSWNTVTAVLN